MIVEKMEFNIGKTPVCVQFDDTYCRDVPPDEMQRRIEHMQNVAGRILARHRLEKMQGKTAGE